LVYPKRIPGKAGKLGLSSVAYFDEQLFLSPHFFGDMIKKEITGVTPSKYRNMN
jgi:hypothetical protein